MGYLVLPSADPGSSWQITGNTNPNDNKFGILSSNPKFIDLFSGGDPFGTLDSQNKMIAIGNFSNSLIKTGNINIGSLSSYYNENTYLVSIGDSAGYFDIGITNTNLNTGTTSIGYSAGYYSIGLNGTYLGMWAGQQMLGNYNIAIGRLSGKNRISSDSVYIGNEAGSGSVNIGSGNISIGQSAGKNSTTSGLYIGQFAGLNSFASNGIGIGSSANRQAGGTRGIGIGISSLFQNLGENVIGIGAESNSGNYGNHTIGIGRNALKQTTSNVGKNYTIGLGTDVGQNNKIPNSFIIKTEYLPEYQNHNDALNNITIAAGGVAGNTYLYRDRSNDQIGYVSL